MTGPVNKPIPLSDDDYARQEEERIALEEARETRGEDFWDGLEARAHAAELLPIDTVDVERVELDTDRMAHQEDLALYAETGRVY